MIPLKNGLNPKQEMFIQNIVNGMSQREAYKNAYNAKYKDKAIDEKACVLFNSVKVQQRYKELMDQLEDKAIMSAKERMIFLTRVIREEEKEKGYTMFGDEIEKAANFKNKLNAIDILNKMSGEYTTKIEADVSVEKLEDLL